MNDKGNHKAAVEPCVGEAKIARLLKVAAIGDVETEGFGDVVLVSGIVTAPNIESVLAGEEGIAFTDKGRFDERCRGIDALIDKMSGERSENSAVGIAYNARNMQSSGGSGDAFVALDDKIQHQALTRGARNIGRDRAGKCGSDELEGTCAMSIGTQTELRRAMCFVEALIDLNRMGWGTRKDQAPLIEKERGRTELASQAEIVGYEEDCFATLGRLFHLLDAARLKLRVTNG